MIGAHLRVPLALAVVVTVAALAAACGGGGDRLSKAEYIAAADKICKEANAQIADLGEPTEETLDDFIGQAEAISRDQLGNLRALKPPAEDEATLNHAYDLIEQQVELTIQGTEAIKNQDQAAFDKVNTEIEKINGEADQIAKDYGLKECGSS